MGRTMITVFAAAAVLATCGGCAAVPGTSGGVAEARSAQYTCSPGYFNLPNTPLCIPVGSRIDPTPGFRGCPYGAVVTPKDNYVCLPAPGGGGTPGIPIQTPGGGGGRPGIPIQTPGGSS